MEMFEQLRDKAAFVGVATVMGAPVVNIAAEPREKWINGIFYNAYGFGKYIFHTEKDGTIMIDAATIDSDARKGGLKFRKIRGKTMAEAVDKFGKWMDKNQKFFLETA